MERNIFIVFFVSIVMSLVTLRNAAANETVYDTVATERRINTKALLLIREFEGLKPHIVEDPYTGRRVIGYGHNCNTARKKCTNLHPPITGHQANILLRSDLFPIERCISKLTEDQDISDDQFSALVSYAFSSNQNCDTLSKSRLIKSIRSGDFKGAAKYFETMATVEMDLLRRRKAERALFCSVDESSLTSKC